MTFLIGKSFIFSLKTSRMNPIPFCIQNFIPLDMEIYTRAAKDIYKIKTIRIITSILWEPPWLTRLNNHRQC